VCKIALAGDRIRTAHRGDFAHAVNPWEKRIRRKNILDAYIDITATWADARRRAQNRS